MLIHTVDEVIGTERDVDWGNGTSRRLLVAADGRPFTVTDTWVRPGTETLLRYDHHVEACYCVEGSAVIHTGSGSFEVNTGSLYSPDKGEEHRVVSEHGMRLICVFSPPLRGDENHSWAAGEPSGY